MTERKATHFDQQQLHRMQEKLVLFTRHLCACGFHIDVDTSIVAQQLMISNNYHDKLQFLKSLKTLLCKNKQQWHSFEQHYCDFWLRKPKMSHTKSSVQSTKISMNAEQEGNTKNIGSTEIKKNHPQENPTSTQSRADIASPIDTDENIDFDSLNSTEILQKLSVACQALARSLSKKLRKTVNATKGERIDLRQTIQRNLKNNGDLIELSWLNKPKIQPRFTLLIDVSRSMTNYSDAFLVFSLALIRHLPETRVFIFNTKLIDITTALRDNRLSKIQEQLKLLNSTWGGGTRIAFSMAELRRRALPQKKSNHHFIIHSDGLDTDPPDALEKQVRAIKQQYRSLLWLSPLLKNADYRVETAALSAALPYIDKLLPIHNLECLFKLTEIMADNRHATNSSRLAYAG